MKHKWTKGQVVAIKKSIKHWEENVKTLKEWVKDGGIITKRTGQHFWETNTTSRCYFDWANCSLCIKYGLTQCACCPLHISGHSCSGLYSVWRKCANAAGNKAIIKSAENMLKVLRGLLK